MNNMMQDITLGKTLEEARKNLKLSVHDMAVQLYLPDDTVLKMENDAFAKGLDVYTRGYLYNYAKAVRLPTSVVDEAIAAWAPQNPDKIVPSVSEPKPISKPISKKKMPPHGSVTMKVLRTVFSVKQPVKLATFIVIVLLMALIIVWHLAHRGIETDLFAQEKAELEKAATNIVSSKPTETTTQPVQLSIHSSEKSPKNSSENSSTKSSAESSENSDLTLSPSSLE